MIRPPDDITANSREASWLRKLRAFIISLTPLSGVGYRVHRGTNGWHLDLDQGPGGGGVKISTYKFRSHSGDHIVCRSWNGSSLGTDDIKIAKPDSLWFSTTTETIDGSTIVTYSDWDTDAQTRHAEISGGGEEDQVIVPRYLTTSIIWAVSTKSLVSVSGEALTLMDLNLAGRAWAAT